MNNIAWVDIETTGLYGKTENTDIGERTHQILEIALVITTPELKVLDTATFTIKHCPNHIRSLMDDYVLNMHTENGLLNKIEYHPDSCISLYDAETALCEYVNHPRVGKKPILAGSSIHFDRFFLSAQMPRLTSLLHHRSIDASSLRYFYEMVTGVAPPELPPEEGGRTSVEHRALGDINYSIGLTKHIRDMMTGTDSDFWSKVKCLL